MAGGEQRRGDASRVTLTKPCAGAWPVILSRSGTGSSPLRRLSISCYSSDIWVLCHFTGRQQSSTVGDQALMTLQLLCSRSPIPLCLDAFPFSKQPVLQMGRLIPKGTLKLSKSTAQMSGKRRNSFCLQRAAAQF